jgi:hypothetical protein
MHRWEDNRTLNLIQIGCKDMNWVRIGSCDDSYELLDSATSLEQMNNQCSWS